MARNERSHQDIDLSKIDQEETEVVSRDEVVDIIQARLEEIFDYVNRELKKIGRDGKLPGGVVLTGGGSNLPGIMEFVKNLISDSFASFLNDLKAFEIAISIFELSKSTNLPSLL